MASQRETEGEEHKRAGVQLQHLSAWQSNGRVLGKEAEEGRKEEDGKERRKWEVTLKNPQKKKKKKSNIIFLSV